MLGAVTTFLHKNRIVPREAPRIDAVVPVNPEDLSLIGVLMTLPFKHRRPACWGRSRAWSKIHARGA